MERNHSMNKKIIEGNKNKQNKIENLRLFNEKNRRNRSAILIKNEGGGREK